MYAKMGRLAIVLSIMQPALDTEQLAAGAFQPAQLHVALQVDCRAFEFSHKFVNAGLPALEASDVRQYPLVNVSDAQTDQIVDMRS